MDSLTSNGLTASVVRIVNMMRQLVVKNTGSSAGRWLDVAPSRFPGWIADFAERHGDSARGAALTVAMTGPNVIFTAPDGAVADCHPPFPPVAGLTADPGACAEAIAAHALAPRAVGVLLVRLGGYAAGVFTGTPPRLAASKTGARPVHGRSAAGGWSQHRFARRREKQASQALQAAADAAVAVFWGWKESQGPDGRPGQRAADNSNRRPAGAPDPGDNSKRRGGDGRDRSGYSGRSAAAGAVSERGTGLDAVVLGGDRRAVAELREDPRLLSYLELATDRFLTVPDPKLAVLKDAPRLYLAVRIMLTEPAN
jgi:Actinobacteria/chloroflexi VLRF1 release factor